MKWPNIGDSVMVLIDNNKGQEWVDAYVLHPLTRGGVAVKLGPGGCVLDITDPNRIDSMKHGDNLMDAQKNNTDYVIPHEVFEELRTFIAQVHLMRKAQKDFFRTRTYEALADAKRYEKAIDEALAIMIERQETGEAIDALRKVINKKHVSHD